MSAPLGPILAAIGFTGGILLIGYSSKNRTTQHETSLPDTLTTATMYARMSTSDQEEVVELREWP